MVLPSDFVDAWSEALHPAPACTVRGSAPCPIRAIDDFFEVQFTSASSHEWHRVGQSALPSSDAPIVSGVRKEDHSQ